MKKQKYSVVAGIILFVLAALFSISLLLVAADFGGINPAKNSIFYSLGKMLTGVYGFCSVFIPIFLIVAGIQCFMSKWRIRNGVVLLGSIFPFFTADAIEHICRMLIESETDTVLIVKISSTLLIGLLILIGEYLLLSILGEILESSLQESREFSQQRFDEDKNEIVFFNSDEDEIDEITDDENSEEKESEKNSEENIDLSNDKIFLEQKEILKDLINDGKPAQEPEERPLEEENSEEETITEDPTIIENEELDDEETIPESVKEDELIDDEDFAEPILPEEPSPFDHIFDEQEKSHEEEISINEEDFQNEYDEMSDARPVDFNENNEFT